MPLFSDPAVGIADPMLARAYRAAERGRGSVSPNPLVGCVVVRDGVVVAEGHHGYAGGPHAEVVALDAAGELARGAGVYVTLEPCNHHGRTPPCVDRLLAAGVASVTIGMADPNPDVTGRGAEALLGAGVRVAWADDPAPFEAQNEAWLRRLRTGRPFVRAKVAVTLDGRPALTTDRRSTITGVGGREVTMGLRRQATAVAVGARTVAIDDPLLTVRSPDGAPEARQPRRVVLCRTTLPGADAALLSDGGAPTTVVASEAADSAHAAALQGLGVRVLRYTLADGLAGALAALAQDGIDDVLIEAGPGLMTGLWDEHLIDELTVVTAGGMGGPAAPPMFSGDADCAGHACIPVLDPIEVGIVGDDAVTVWRPRTSRHAQRGKGSVD